MDHVGVFHLLGHNICHRIALICSLVAECLCSAIKSRFLLVAKHLLIRVNSAPVVLPRALLARCPFSMRLDVLLLILWLLFSGPASWVNKILCSFIALYTLVPKTVLLRLLYSRGPGILAGRNLSKRLLFVRLINTFLDVVELVSKACQILSLHNVLHIAGGGCRFALSEVAVNVLIVIFQTRMHNNLARHLFSRLAVLLDSFGGQLPQLLLLVKVWSHADKRRVL